MRIYVLHAPMVSIWSDSRARERKRIFPLFRVSNPCLGCPTLHLGFHFDLGVLGVLGSRVHGLRFSATCCGLDGNIGVNGDI